MLLGMAVAVAAVYQGETVFQLRSQVRVLRRELAGSDRLRAQVRQLGRERDAATNAVAVLAAENVALKRSPSDVLRLRGEVGRLTHDKAQLGATGADRRLTADPVARDALREQNRAGLKQICQGFARSAKLAPAQAEKLYDLLADDIMAHVEPITAFLRDKPPLAEVDRYFAGEDAALQNRLRDLLGAQCLAQYQDYVRNLVGSLGAEEFKAQLTGTDAEKQAKAKQLAQAFQQAAATAVAEAGLPADYQTRPELNYVCSASEEGAARGLRVLDDIYQRVAAGGGSFLSPEELGKFEQQRQSTLKDVKLNLTLTQTLLAPIAQ